MNDRLASWKVPANRFTAVAKVTLRRILSHTAGLTVHGFPGYAIGEPLPTVPQILDGEPPANTAPVRVDTVPGAVSRYSGGGYLVAMVLVTDVTGEPFPELMHRLVLGPAGMARSTYRQPPPDSLLADAAGGHDSEGRAVPGHYHLYPEMSAAGLWTTPSDLARLAIELQRTYAGRSNRIVSELTWKRMLEVQPPAGDEPFGLGFGIRGNGADREFEHGGAVLGFRAQLVAYAERGQGAVIMTNGDQGDRLIEELLASIAAEYGWPGHHPVELTVASLAPEAKQALLGTYQLNVKGFGEGKAVVTLEAGRLELDVNIGGLGKDELLAETDSTFSLRESGVSVGFERKPDGRVVAIVIDGAVRGTKRE